MYNLANECISIISKFTVDYCDIIVTVIYMYIYIIMIILFIIIYYLMTS